MPVDLGIVRGVKILKDAGFTTIESCEGGKGHYYAEPTIQFVGSHATGWAAMAELMTYGLPIRRLGQMWTFDHSYGQGHPTGPEWFITFYRKLLSVRQIGEKGSRAIGAGTRCGVWTGSMQMADVLEDPRLGMPLGY